MNEDKASPADRFLIRGVLAGAGAPNSLANVNTGTLPNGACCYVITEKSIWQLDKTSTTGTVAGSSLAAMGGGTWFLLSSSEVFAGGCEVLSTDFNSFPVGGTWGQTTSSNSALTGTPTQWSLTAAGYILTYGGPTRDFYVTMAASVRVGEATAHRSAFLGISKNNDLTGTPSFGASGAIDTTLDTANESIAMTTVRKVTLANGDTLRPKMAGATAAVSLQGLIRTIVAPG